ncbi:unnamed protein product [Meloidogyne enterolobii]|uniref:Uncharacterized protein n=1 Tax=Meloidogyne enterolobii TaxID=390850 RepID=A0ACB0YCR5_MELEN
MRKTTSVNKSKPRANTIAANRKNLNSSNQNSILNYVDSKPSSSSSNCRITRQNKRQTYCDNSDENIKQQENSRQTKNAKFEAEQFLEIDRCFKTVEAGRRNDAEKLIPDSLEDLASDNEEDKKLGELGREIDCLISSDHVKRLHADNELFIEFNYFTFEIVGSFGKVFSIKTPENARRVSKIYKNNCFQLIFFSSLNSTLRSALLECFHSLAVSDGIEISFDNFVTVFCYVFQTKPSNLKINNSDDLIENMYTLMEEEKPVENAKDVWTILHENIYSFFDCFIFINFTHWNNQQLISLFCLLCRIYFDKQIINCRYLISNAFKLLIKQLFSADVDRLNSILNEFLNKKLLECVDGNIGRTFELFTLFAQFEQFTEHKLSTFRSILHSISSTNLTKKSNPSLDNVISILPCVVKKLKLNKNYTDLYFIYTRFVDELTIDKNLLQHEKEKSLEMAEHYFREASLYLNKRNINDKMIDMWSRSLHRIREVLQNMRNNATTLNNLTDFKVLQKQQKWQPTTINITSDSIWSTSSDEEGEENNK